MEIGYVYGGVGGFLGSASPIVFSEPVQVLCVDGSPVPRTKKWYVGVDLRDIDLKLQARYGGSGCTRYAT